jgi:hypothetical protein
MLAQEYAATTVDEICARAGADRECDALAIHGRRPFRR